MDEDHLDISNVNLISNLITANNSSEVNQANAINNDS
jgi:hypothetical protein